jgi:hypothetical protein
MACVLHVFLLTAQLEELKAKDHQLALLDRNQYPDRGASLPKQHQSNEGQPKEPDSAAASRPVKPATAGEANDGSAYQINVSAQCSSKLTYLLEKTEMAEARFAVVLTTNVVICVRARLHCGFQTVT